MIILSTVDTSLQVVLSGAVATNECPITAHWVDLTTDATSFVSAAADLETDGATPVEVVPAPVADAQRQIKLLTIYNADTAVITATVQYLDDTDTRVLVSIALAVGSTLVYTDGEGFRVIDASGVTLSGQPYPLLVSRVASDQATASTSLVDVAGLSLPLVGNAIYAFTAVLSVASSGVTGALYGVDCTSSGATVEAHATGTLTASSTRTARISALATATAAYVTVAADGGVTISGVVTTGALAGVLTIQQACAVSGTVTTYANSLLSALRIA